MDATPKGNRLHIALLGRTNVGKSSILNMITGQDIAITSPVAGTTTDVVEKAMELLPLGPVLFLDTAGLDDVSKLSSLRLKKTEKIFDRADVAILVTEPDFWGTYEEEVMAEMNRRKTPSSWLSTKSISIVHQDNSFATCRQKRFTSYPYPLSMPKSAIPFWTP